MNRGFFIGSAASAICLGRPLLGKAERLTQRVRAQTIAQTSDWRQPSWHCKSAVVWLDVPSGIYYYKGDRRYGHTKDGAYACKKAAMAAGNRAEGDD
jgi:hypothetical protein